MSFSSERSEWYSAFRVHCSALCRRVLLGDVKEVKVYLYNMNDVKSDKLSRGIINPMLPLTS